MSSCSFGWVEGRGHAAGVPSCAGPCLCAGLGHRWAGPGAPAARPPPVRCSSSNS